MREGYWSREPPGSDQHGSLWTPPNSWGIPSLIEGSQVSLLPFPPFPWETGTAQRKICQWKMTKQKSELCRQVCDTPQSPQSHFPFKS
jgi:hypothetical protein